jgi:hypothetical protein
MSHVDYHHSLPEAQSTVESHFVPWILLRYVAEDEWGTSVADDNLHCSIKPLEQQPLSAFLKMKDKSLLETTLLDVLYYPILTSVQHGNKLSRRESRSQCASCKKDVEQGQKEWCHQLGIAFLVFKCRFRIWKGLGGVRTEGMCEMGTPGSLRRQLAAASHMVKLPVELTYSPPKKEAPDTPTNHLLLEVEQGMLSPSNKR